MEAALHRRTVAVTRQGTPPLPRTGEGGVRATVYRRRRPFLQWQ